MPGMPGPGSTRKTTVHNVCGFHRVIFIILAALGVERQGRFIAEIEQLHAGPVAAPFVDHDRAPAALVVTGQGPPAGKHQPGAGDIRLPGPLPPVAVQPYRGPDKPDSEPAKAAPERMKQRDGHRGRP